MCGQDTRGGQAWDLGEDMLRIPVKSAACSD